MRTRLLSLLFASALVPNVALAADAIEPIIDDTPVEPVVSVPTNNDYFYVGAYGGLALTDDTAFGLTTPSTTFTSVLNDFKDSGFDLGVTAGKAFDLGGYSVRGELEAGFSRSEIDSHTLQALATTFSGGSAFGKTDILYGMVNGAVDIDTGTKFTPYATAGLGLANVDYKNHGVVLPAATAGLPAGAVTAMDDDDTAFAWQVGAGTAYELTENLALDVGYKYFRVEDVNLTGALGDTSEFDLDQHKIRAGVRLKF